MKRLLIVAVLLASACGGNSSGPSEVIPNYAGNWRGNYVISGCNQTGTIAIANICGSLGQSPPYTMNLTQSSRNVSGSFALGGINFPNTGGTVAPGGSLALSATTQDSGITIVVNWMLNLNAAQALTGTQTQAWTSNAVSGQANVVGTISTATR